LNREPENGRSQSDRCGDFGSRWELKGMRSDRYRPRDDAYSSTGPMRSDKETRGKERARKRARKEKIKKKRKEKRAKRKERMRRVKERKRKKATQTGGGDLRENMKQHTMKEQAGKFIVEQSSLSAIKKKISEMKKRTSYLAEQISRLKRQSNRSHEDSDSYDSDSYYDSSYDSSSSNNDEHTYNHH
jgi:hypothetical protein